MNCSNSNSVIDDDSDAYYYYNHYANSSIVKPLLNNAMLSTLRSGLSSMAASASYNYHYGTHEIERLDNDHIRSFLISAKANTNGWQVSESTLKENLEKSAIGKPLVIDRVNGRIDHPIWDTNKTEHDNFIAQSSKAIGTIEAVHYNSDNQHIPDVCYKQ